MPFPAFVEPRRLVYSDEAVARIAELVDRGWKRLAIPEVAGLSPAAITKCVSPGNTINAGMAETILALGQARRARSWSLRAFSAFSGSMSSPMAWIKRQLTGGSMANAHLTAVVAAVLIVLLAIEGATLLRLQPLLTVHAFVGMLLIPVVALKLASTGWRMLRYYSGSGEYVSRGPPPLMLRALVAPVLILSTISLFATGVVLLAHGQTEGSVAGLHKASFIVWLGAAVVHVLAHVWKLPRLLRLRTAGVGLGVVLVASAVVAGAVIAIATLPAADRLQDDVSAHVNLDAD